MFKVNNKNNRTTSLTLLWCFYCQLWSYFTPFSSVSIADFEQVNVSWEWVDGKKYHQIQKFNDLVRSIFRILTYFSVVLKLQKDSLQLLKLSTSSRFNLLNYILYLSNRVIVAINI